MTSSRLLLNIVIASLLICSLPKSQQSGPTRRLNAGTALPAAGKPSAGPQAIDQKTTMSALPIAAQTQISAVLGRDKRAYQSVAQPGGFRLGNSQQGVSAEFAKNGVDFHSGNNSWGMVLQGYGHGEKIRPAATVAPHADANRIEYRRGELTEWYLNGPVGLEQGFTLAHAPDQRAGKPLTLTLALSGNLAASVDPDGRGLTLKKNGTAALRYSGLIATDARGRELHAWIELDDNQLSLLVNDASAVYPLTVDPLVQTAKLTGSDGVLGDVRGNWLAISNDGSTIVAGASGEFVEVDGTDEPHGAAYVFVKPLGGWATGMETAKLTPSDFSAMFDFDSFGSAVAVSSDGSTIVVGAFEANIDTVFAGAAYVFVKPAGGWAPTTETAKLTASDVQDDEFGTSIGVSGDGNTIIVGAVEAKAAYVFVKPTGGWVTGNETARLTPSDASLSELFGVAVSISCDGSTVVSGASFSGAALVFVKPSGGWVSTSETATLVPSDAVFGDGFGSSLGVSGDGSTIIVGESSLLGEFNSQTAYVFVEPGGGWGPGTETAKLTASDGVSGDDFGSSLRVSGDGNKIVVGAFNHDSSQGAAYVFVKPSSGWATETEAAKLIASDGVAGEDFGNSVAVNSDGSTIIVGKTGATLSERAVYVFTSPVVAPNASLSTSSLTFGSQAVGTTSSSQMVMLTNTGNADLHVTGVAASSGFSSSSNCVTQSPIDAGKSCTENIAFAPGSVTSFTGMLTFTDDSRGIASTTQTVTLGGTGVQATSSVSLSAGAAITGFPVTVSFTVNPQSGDTLTPSGSVTLSGGGQSCTKNAPSGSCPFTFSTSGMVTIIGTYAGDTNFSGNSNTLSLSLSVTPAGVMNVVNEEQTLGCIDNSGIAGALNAKLAAAQANIAAGQTQQAINTLKALLNQLQAQEGKHVAATCTDHSGNTIDLIGLVKTLLASLGFIANADPITGNVLNVSGAGFSGLAVSITNSKNATVLTATTDVTGFYYFPTTSSLTSGTTYTVKAAVPKGYKSSTPGSQSFTWRATGLSLSNFTVN